MKNPIFQTNLSSFRGWRSGSWDNNAQNVRVLYRDGFAPEYTFPDLGFRIFRTKENS